MGDLFAPGAAHILEDLFADLLAGEGLAQHEQDFLLESVLEALDCQGKRSLGIDEHAALPWVVTQGDLQHLETGVQAGVEAFELYLDQRWSRLKHCPQNQKAVTHSRHSFPTGNAT